VNRASSGDDAPPALILATRNAGKVRELEPLVRACGWRAVSLDAAGVTPHADEDSLEVFDTFAENALAKATYYHARSGGRVVLAEDSGLCVDALHGAPGVHSKRWRAESLTAGASLDAHHVAELLSVMADEAHRAARFVCVATLVWDGGTLSRTGTVEGEILRERCGTGGFGYDPVFWSHELQRCFGDVTREEKSAVSHRARAVRALLHAFAEGAR
jgi:XTP/dITP diphosphohydrolase